MSIRLSLFYLAIVELHELLINVLSIKRGYSLYTIQKNLFSNYALDIFNSRTLALLLNQDGVYHQNYTSLELETKVISQ